MTRMAFGFGVIFLLACVSGCRSWRPSMGTVTTQPAGPGFDLNDYLRAMRRGQWTYKRCSAPCEESSERDLYARIQYGRRMKEGRLVEADFQAIEHYLQPKDADEKPSVDETLKELKGAGFVFFKLEEPLEPIPRTLARGQPEVATTELTYYDYRGRRAATGELTRTVELEGFETVICPAGTFEDCLRVRVDLDVKFPWVLRLSWSSYLWISPRVGEVRRVHHLSGWFLIFWFSSGHEYELQDRKDIDKSDATGVLSPRWSTGAILFDRIAPKPVIGGMIVDFAESAMP